MTGQGRLPPASPEVIFRSGCGQLKVTPRGGAAAPFVADSPMVRYPARDGEDAMEHAGSEQADRALTRYVKGGRTLADIGTEFVYLRRER
jgi:hypothetical protein